ncbi:hypothetical protein ACOSQ3_024258 [Xanthoceras sorbifolium]
MEGGGGGGKRFAKGATSVAVLNKYLIYSKYILAWRKNSIAKFPILSLIAKDVFAMPISTVAFESAFSTGGRILDPFRSSLTPKMVEGLILTGNWLQANHPIAEPHVIQEHARNDDTSVDMLEHYLHVQSEIDNASGVICVLLEDN